MRFIIVRFWRSGSPGAPRPTRRADGPSLCIADGVGRGGWVYKAGALGRLAEEAWLKE